MDDDWLTRDDDADRVEAVQRRTVEAILGAPGRLLGLSKTAYREEHSGHLVIFNANVCVGGQKRWHGDFDLTDGGETELLALARETGRVVDVLFETDARFENEERPLTDRAVYSVAPSGHNRFDCVLAERRDDGRLYHRPARLEQRRVRVRHRPFQLHAWVFRQDEVWVDLRGIEREIAAMTEDYAQSVLTFCRTRALCIAALVVASERLGADDALVGLFRPSDDFAEVARIHERAQAWLEATPLMGALRRRVSADG